MQLVCERHQELINVEQHALGEKRGPHDITTRGQRHGGSARRTCTVVLWSEKGELKKVVMTFITVTVT